MVIIMKTWLVLQLWILLLLSAKTDGIFFQYPKKAVADFLQSIHGKKEIKKPPANVHHYHLHYYPVPSWLTIKRAPFLGSHEIDVLHSDRVRSLGWKDQSLDPGIVFPVPISSIKSDPFGLPWSWENELFGKSHTFQSSFSSPGILYPFPLHQQIVLYQPEVKEKKPSLLTAFLEKLHHIKEVLFHHEKKDECKDKHNKPTITNNFISY